MIQPEPLISVIMAVYNGENYLKDCIQGITAQTFDNFECIVVNDGSKDNTLSMLEKWQSEFSNVYIINQENRGLTASLNTAIALAKGKYICRQDADDISLPYRLEKQFFFLEQNKQAVLAGTHFVEFVDLKTCIALNCFPDNPELILHTIQYKKNVLMHGSIMFRRDSFNNLDDGYRFTYGQDLDLYFRIKHFGELRIVPEVLCARRYHPETITSGVTKMRGPIGKVMRQLNGINPLGQNLENFLRQNPDNNSWKKIEEHIFNQIPVLSEKERSISNFKVRINSYLLQGKRLQSLYLIISTKLKYPLDFKSWIFFFQTLFLLFFPRSVLIKLYLIFSKDDFRKPCSISYLYDLFNN